MFVFYRQLLFTAFDSELAQVFGVPSQWVEIGFALALAATIVASMNIVGVTLIAAAIVIPPSTARLLTHEFGTMLVLSTLIGSALRGDRHVPELPRGHLVRLGDRAAGGGLLRAGLCRHDAAPRTATGAEARRGAGTGRAVDGGAESMIEISEVTELTEQQAAELADILIRIVKSGASIGWLDTPDPAEARAYWQTVVRKPENVLLLATENGHVVGTAYLELAQRENGRHRAEVNKVLVHPDQQGKGIGRKLMEVIEASAGRGAGHAAPRYGPVRRFERLLHALRVHPGRHRPELGPLRPGRDAPWHDVLLQGARLARTLQP